VVRTAPPKITAATAMPLNYKTGKGLHYNFRKQQLEKIERENAIIAKKIFGLKSDMNIKVMEKDFRSHLGYKNNIARLRKRKNMPMHEGLPGQLAPLS